jgi:uncharacterized membrane protein YhaH (DUF805 family)
MAGAIEVGGDVSAAAAALAGLLLVFIGSISTTFDSYAKQEQGAVRGRYQRRVWFAFVGFIFAILATAFGIAGKSLHQECIATAAIACLVISLAVSLFAALFSAMEIR